MTGWVIKPGPFVVCQNFYIHVANDPDSRNGIIFTHISQLMLGTRFILWVDTKS